MKRSLHVVGQESEVTPSEPAHVRVGARTVVIEEAGNGAAARRLADWMVDAGATRVSEDVDAGALRIVIRGGPRSADSDLEADADFVLGSARPAFARRLVTVLQADDTP